MAPTMDNIAQAVADGKGVLTSHFAGELWNAPDMDEEDKHAIVVTGMTYDAEGKIEHVVINDTGTGEARKSIPAEQFERSLIAERPANVTKTKIW